MKIVTLIITLALFNYSIAQDFPVDSLLFSKSGEKLLKFEFSRLNNANPNVWVLYNLGLNEYSDTIVLTNDTAYFVSYSSLSSDCEVYKDQTGQSFYCIKKRLPLMSFLSAYQFEQKAIKTNKHLNISFSCLEKKIIQKKLECADQYVAIQGKVLITVTYESNSFCQDTLNFEYQSSIDKSLEYYTDEILFEDAQASCESELWESKNGNAKFLDLIFYFISESGEDCIKNENQEWEHYFHEIGGLYFIKYLKTTTNKK